MKVVLVGSGNVASHLGKALMRAGHKILQVYSRSLTNATELANLLEAKPVDSIAALNPDGDIYMIAVPDNAIAEVSGMFPFDGKFIVHTSGTTSVDVLQKGVGRSGVFYPLQTFSKGRDVDFSLVPIAVEASLAEDQMVLLELGRSISNTVFTFNSEKRKALHLAAVFACNFSNHFYAIAGNLISEAGLDFDLLKPLIAETSAKIQNLSPFDAQTGPAIRNDQVTIDNHISLLQNKPELQEMYRLISQSIINLHQKA